MHVLVPTYKKPEQVEKCLAYFRAFDDRGEFKVLTREDLDAEGFTKNVNALLRRAIAEGPYKYALILNQDLYLKDRAFDRMFEFMQTHPRCAIAGIKQLSSENEDHIIHGGTYECFPTGRHEGGLVSKGDCNVSKQVPWVNGACMIVRMEALLEIGLMDPNYKMFGSDADWSYTARQRGWETWYIAEAVCVHEQGASKTQDEKMARVFDADMNYFAGKWLGDDQFRELSMEVFT